MSEFFWLLEGCTNVEAFSLIAPEDSTFDFNLVLKVVQTAIHDMPLLNRLQLRCRPCMFDTIAFINNFESSDDKSVAKLETLAISLHGLVNGNPANDKIFEALYMVLEPSGQAVKNFQCSVSTDSVGLGRQITAPKSCCVMHRPKPGHEMSVPMLDKYVGIVFPNVQKVELCLQGVFRHPERWLGVDFGKVRNLSIRHSVRDQYFDLKRNIEIGRFRNLSPKGPQLFHHSERQLDVELQQKFLRELPPLPTKAIAKNVPALKQVVTRAASLDLFVEPKVQLEVTENTTTTDEDSDYVPQERKPSFGATKRRKS
ncbi:hypothetical protein TWF696_000302 [Orbilia brochopaga]|uniref:Uncharacterized protein n=1 Tax=Orbilia brochopaga TaxID=3140254 RepID=A0AAV9VDY5_9PEZI